MKRKFTLLLSMLLLLGTGSMVAQNMRAYSTGISDSNSNISYNAETKTWTWSTTNSNQLTIFSFTAGTLSKFNSINWTSSNSSLTSGVRYRILFYAGNTNLGGVTPYSDGSKNIDLTQINKDGSSSTYLTAEELATVTAIKFSGSNGGTGSTVVDLDGIYLEADHGIGTTADWKTLSDVVSAGLTKVNVSMTADVDAGSTMVGTSAKPYQGTFDGAGHTLTFNFDNTASGNERIAPFKEVKDATIKELLTTGKAHGYNLAAGIVGNVAGNCTLQNCGSNMDVYVSYDSDNVRGGGLVARCAEQDATVTFNYCLFNGSLKNEGSSRNRVSGLVGWVASDKNNSVTANNCLIAPTSVIGGANNITPSVTPTVSNTFYTTKFSTSTQGTAATNVQLASGTLAFDLNTNNTGTLFFGQANLNRSNVEAYPSLTSDATKKVVKVKIGGMSTTPCVNPGGAVPNPVRFKVTGFKKSSGDAYTLEAMPAESEFTYGTDDSASKLETTKKMYCITLPAGATTLVLPFGCDVPEGITAYSIAYTSGNTVTATKVEKIEANKPVLINGTKGTRYKFSTDTDATYSSSTATNGALTGVFVQQGSSDTYNPFVFVPKDSYVLQNGKSGLGFYKVAAENSVRITSFRAYLTAQSEARALQIAFADDETTGIDNVKAQQETDAVYSLNGMRVANPTKGIYVKNGKKFIVK